MRERGRFSAPDPVGETCAGDLRDENVVECVTKMIPPVDLLRG